MPLRHGTLTRRRSRHRLGAGVAALASAVTLMGCASTQTLPVPEATGAPEADYYFVAGDLPERPQRVLALWRTGSLLTDLGVVPVATLEGEIRESELTPTEYAAVAGVPVIGSSDALDIERVIDADPDLIIGMDNGALGLDYEEMARLYPVAILRTAEPTDVWASYEVVAELTGHTDTYEAEAEALEARLTQLSQTYGEALESMPTTVVDSFRGTGWVDTSTSVSCQRLLQAGFVYNERYTDNPDRYQREITLENLPSLADQAIIFYHADLEGGVTPDVQALLDEPAFQQLPAAQAGHVYPLRGSLVYTFTSANLMVDDLLAAAQDDLMTTDALPRAELLRWPVRIRELELLRCEQVAPRMIRLTFGGPNHVGFESHIFDEHVKLLFPSLDGKLRLPKQDRDHLDWPRPRPVNRDYTVRRYDPGAGEVDFDVVVHEGGVASDWAVNAEPGTTIWMAGPPRGRHIPDGFTWQAYLGDATAIPAIARRLEELPRDIRGVVLIEVDDDADEQTLPAHPGMSVRWLHRSRGQLLTDALPSIPGGGRSYVWFGGEQANVRPLRRWVKEAGLERHSFDLVGYWRAGATGDKVDHNGLVHAAKHVLGLDH